MSVGQAVTTAVVDLCTPPSSPAHNAEPAAAHAAWKRKAPAAPPAPPLSLDSDSDDDCMVVAAPAAAPPATTDAADSDEDLVFIGMTGSVALADFPHSRVDCLKEPWTAGVAKANERCCSNCFCYVCDVPAAHCGEWQEHAHASGDNPQWRARREAAKRQRDATLSSAAGLSHEAVVSCVASTVGDRASRSAAGTSSSQSRPAAAQPRVSAEGLRHAFRCTATACDVPECAENRRLIQRILLHTRRCPIAAAAATATSGLSCKICRIHRRLSAAERRSRHRAPRPASAQPYAHAHPAAGAAAAAAATPQATATPQLRVVVPLVNTGGRRAPISSPAFVSSQRLQRRQARRQEAGTPQKAPARAVAQASAAEGQAAVPHALLRAHERAPCRGSPAALQQAAGAPHAPRAQPSFFADAASFFADAASVSARARAAELVMEGDEECAPCTVCGEAEWVEGNEILLCDGNGCASTYHLFCLDRPLRCVPEGDWFCPECARPTA